MTVTFWLPVAILLSSFVPGVVIFLLPEEQSGARTALNLIGAVIKVVLVIGMIWGITEGRIYEARIPLLPDIDLVLHASRLPVLFISLSAVLWLLTTIYAVGYLEGSPHRSRFFGFFSLCVSATTGVAMAGNLLSFLVFYEILTLVTWPLVIHRGTEEAHQAGRVYLAYTLTGGALLMVGITWLHALVGPVDFVERGALAGIGPDYHGQLKVIFALLIAGLGVKAALVPLHGWLPHAMVAPAPVSALLHAVAVVKAGAFGIVRVMYDVFGIEFATTLGVHRPLALVASITIIYGSIQALAQDDLKRRLAFSTVSQISYIILGVATLGRLATIGGVVHLVHQALMKITLFFCAGILLETLGIHRVSEMNGVGRRMPLTMIAFSLAALGMIGLPPMAGFISKWYLGLGGLDAGDPWVLAVLLVSTILNAAYFLPILHAAWFRPANSPWPEARRGEFETRLYLLLPPLITALLFILAGLFAAAPVSPTAWCHVIADAEYGQ
ncbi:complex I subunit 5 family protein [Nannocystis pusilla]|uniref:Monovalent cation/H+ antiporter subunit D family protein n=1 Tax=Nannocystis pusilla TaxID=889268 RepID=A0ABS7U5A7_9BACT|nr:proton-conducting transporter membrane subunit [Nannocystis pusilla]MBZ5715670.1 monovalent cation/H+ antiporter subunit D family protein [Nannocystis pusilla]